MEILKCFVAMFNLLIEKYYIIEIVYYKYSHSPAKYSKR